MYKIYLDTNVVNQLFAGDRPDWKEATERLWGLLQKNQHEIFISPVVLEELNRCNEPLKNSLYGKLNLLTPNLLENDEEVEALSQKYLDAGFIPKRWKNDCLHIAYAVVYECDVIISWNLEHFSNPKVIRSVNEINTACRYNKIAILTASDFLEMEGV